MQLDLPWSPEPDAGIPLRADPTAGTPAHTTFVRHRWARRYILRVLDDGTVRVTLPRWGSKREAATFVETSAPWIERQRDLRRAVPRTTHPDEPALRARAAKELPPVLLALAARHDITVTRVSVRNQRSRWGACSADGAITLNWRLILTPDFVRDYVMLHELMHRCELNHSRRFWRLIAAVSPRYREARQWLLRDGQALFCGRETR